MCPQLFYTRASSWELGLDFILIGQRGVLITKISFYVYSSHVWQDQCHHAKLDYRQSRHASSDR